MFKKIKQFLGIEGIKMEITLPENLSSKTRSIQGKIEFSTMNTQRISSINLKIIERYTQGRGKEKRTEEFVLGEATIEEGFMVYPEDIVVVEFELPYQKLHSKIEVTSKRGGVLGGIAKIAKIARGAKSEYRIEAQAKVAGTALHPFAKETVIFTK